MIFDIGRIVFSKTGRDKGRPFIIHSIKDEFVFLIDGDLRKLDKPKKKKSKHVQITNDVSYEIKEKLESGAYLNDADIKRVLKPYYRKNFPAQPSIPSQGDSSLAPSMGAMQESHR